MWDYTGDCYAHRALRGHVVSSHGGGGGRRDSGYGYEYRGDGMNQERGGLAGARAGVERGARGGAGRDGSPPLYSEVGAVDGGGSCARGDLQRR